MSSKQITSIRRTSYKRTLLTSLMSTSPVFIDSSKRPSTVIIPTQLPHTGTGGLGVVPWSDGRREGSHVGIRVLEPINISPRL